MIKRSVTPPVKVASQTRALLEFIKMCFVVWRAHSMYVRVGLYRNIGVHVHANHVHAKHKVILAWFAHWSFHYFVSFKGSLWVHTAGALGRTQKRPLG